MSIQHKEPTHNPFAETAHEKAQDAIDRARETRERNIADRGQE